MGDIPTDVGLMQSLQTLSISGTQIGGNIPSELYTTPIVTFKAANCRLTGPLLGDVSSANTTLQDFVVSDNELTGPVPSEAFALCEKLEALELEGNRLTGSISPDLCAARICRPTSPHCLSTVRVDCEVTCDCCEHRPDCPDLA